MLLEKKVLSVAIAATLALAGCGGGGDDNAAAQPGAPNTPADPLAPSYVINESNVVQTAQLAFNGMAGYLSPFSGNGAANAAPSLQELLQKAVAERALRALGPARAGRPAPGALSPQAVETDTYPCAYGGSVTETIVDADGDEDTVQVGDRIETRYDNCKEWPDVTFNGTERTVVTAVRAFSATRDDASLAAQGDIAIQVGGVRGRVVGNLTLDFDMTRACWDCDPISGKLTFGSSGLTIELGGDSVKLHRFTYAATYDAPSRTYSFTQDSVQEVRSSIFGVATNTRFLGTFEQYPHQGQATITGKGSRLVVTALPGNQVRLDLDEDGNGSIDKTRTVSSDQVFVTFRLSL